MPMRAKEIMTTDVVCARPTDSIAAVARQLSARHISAMPVCSPTGQLVGIISEGDLVRPFRESRRLKKNWWLDMLAEGTDLAQNFVDYMRTDTKSAEELMSRQVVTAGPDATLPELAELMASRNVKRVPIMDGDKVVGIVSRADVIRAISDTPAMLV